MKFQEWLAKVDEKLEAFAGVCMLDLPDWRYAEAYEDGLQPITAARLAVAAAGAW